MSEQGHTEAELQTIAREAITSLMVNIERVPDQPELHPGVVARAAILAFCNYTESRFGAKTTAALLRAMLSQVEHGNLADLPPEGRA